MIIECPACKTKFSVESELISKSKDPRFHCSRCKTVFSLNNKKETKSLVTADWPSGSSTMSKKVDMRKEREKMDDGEQLSLNFSGVASETPVRPKFELNKSVADKIQNKMAEVTTQNTADDDGWTLGSDDKEEDKIEEPSFDSFVTSHVPDEAPSSDMFFDDLQNEEVNSENDIEIDEREILAIASKSELPSMARFFSVPLAIFFVLAMLGQHLHSVPAIAESIFSIANTSYPSTPPVGLELENLKSKVVTLDDGHQVFEVTGEIINNSEKLVEDIHIRTGLFDNEGTQKTAIITAMNNGLQNVIRVQSLKNDIISSLQQQRIENNNSLEKSQRAPFRAIFTKDISGTAWFTARVYSVKNS